MDTTTPALCTVVCNVVAVQTRYLQATLKRPARIAAFDYTNPTLDRVVSTVTFARDIYLVAAKHCFAKKGIVPKKLLRLPTPTGDGYLFVVVDDHLLPLGAGPSPGPDLRPLG